MKSSWKIVAVLLFVGGMLLPLSASAAGKSALPRLVDVGADKCIPCKMMASILDDLKATYSGKLDVEFVDVWKHREEAQTYGVKMIPTQIFYSPDGKELYRHQGFFAKEDILAKWHALGYNLKK